MSAANILSWHMREKLRALVRWIRARSGRLMLAAVMLVSICSMAFATQLIDRSLNYAPVDAVTRAITHECTASRRYKVNKDNWGYKTISGKSCEELRALVQTDGYRRYTVHDEAFVSLVYRSPADKGLYIGKLPLAFYSDPAKVPAGARLTILASKTHPDKIAVCCHSRIDWFDTPAAL